MQNCGSFSSLLSLIMPLLLSLQNTLSAFEKKIIIKYSAPELKGLDNNQTVVFFFKLENQKIVQLFGNNFYCVL